MKQILNLRMYFFNPMVKGSEWVIIIELWILPLNHNLKYNHEVWWIRSSDIIGLSLRSGIPIWNQHENNLQNK